MADRTGGGSMRIVRKEEEVDLCGCLAWLVKQKFVDIRRLDLDIWLGFLSVKHLIQPWREAPREEVQVDFDLLIEYQSWLVALLSSYQLFWTGYIFGNPGLLPRLGRWFLGDVVGNHEMHGILPERTQNSNHKLWWHYRYLEWFGPPAYSFGYDLGVFYALLLFIIPLTGFYGVRLEKPSFLVAYTVMNWALVVPLCCYYPFPLIGFISYMCERYNSFPHSKIWPKGEGSEFHDYTPLADWFWIMYHVYLLITMILGMFISVFAGYYSLKLWRKMVDDQREAIEHKFIEL